ncbi:hypothetical protein [Treponema sp.]|uniref:hypothetical protein n=1 Tax=Treponema sp. TaxID=166 RepID=UPI003890551B
MKKNLLILFVLFSIFTFPSFAKTGFEIGFGSGYFFYGSDSVKSRNKALGDSNQAVIISDVLFLLPFHENVIFELGVDSAFDFRWRGSDHINLIDYAFLSGFRVYPNLGGLYFSTDYAIGRRTDFISYDNEDDIKSTKWGNGFKFALGYDFSYHMKSYAPVICISLKNMPRANSRDSILGISLKITKHK